MSPERLRRELKAVAPLAAWATRAALAPSTVSRICAGMSGYTDRAAHKKLQALLESYHRREWRFLPAEKASEWRWEGRAAFEATRFTVQWTDSGPELSRR